MFRALFGKLAPTASNAEANAEEKLDNLEAGTGGAAEITSGKHATHFHLPSMKAELVEKQDYIPAKLAEDTLKDAMLAYDSAKALYEDRIAALHAHHERTTKEREAYFQLQTAELREKVRPST